MIINEEEYKYVLEGHDYHCALGVTMFFIVGNWKTMVLGYLGKSKKRFSELKAHIPDTTDKMLSVQLKQPVKDGMVKKQIFAEVPPRVEHSPTDHGKTLIPILGEMAKWER